MYVQRHAPAVSLAACLLVGLAFPVGSAQAQVRTTSNGHVQVSQRAVNLLFERDVLDARQICETILGTSTTGYVETRGRVTAHLRPSGDRCLIEVRLGGLADVRNGVADRRSVTIFTSARTAINASKLVQVSDAGLHPHEATANCQSTVRIDGITARGRLMEGLAWRIANRNHGEYEAAAAERAGARAAQQLDWECNKLFGAANRMFREKIRTPMIQEGLWPSFWQYETTPTHLQMYLLGANLPAGPVTRERPAAATDHDVAVSLHESLVNHVVDNTLTGMAIEDGQWLELMRVFTGQAPRPLWVHERTPHWHVVFAQERPARVVFDEGGFVLTLRLSHVTRGDRTYDAPLTVTTRHAFDITPDGLRMIRQGDLDIRLESNAASDALPAELEFVRQKLNAVFQPEIFFDGLVPPAGASWDKLRRLQLEQVAATNGWLTFGYHLAPTVDQVAAAPVTRR